MKYYQAVYQTDSYGCNTFYSTEIWKTKEEAQEYISDLIELMNEDFIYDSWVRELFVEDL